MPNLIGVVTTTLMWLLLRQWAVPDTMMRYATFTLANVLLLSTITFVWQISLHTASIAGLVVIVAYLFGIPYAAVLSPCILLVGLARLTLKRHTPLQILAGGTLGAVIAYVVFFMR